MRFSIDREALKKAVDAAHGLVNKNTPAPILSHVCISANADGYITFSATDTETFLSIKVAALDVEPGETTASAHMLYDITRVLPNYTAPVSVFTDDDDKFLCIGASSARFKMPTLSAEAFPANDLAPESGELTSLEIGSTVLARMIKFASACMPSDEIRYYLNGLYLTKDADSGQLHAVATDGHRLCLITEDGFNDVEFEGIIIPRKTVISVSRLLDNTDHPVRIEFSQASIRFLINDNTEMLARLIDGRFPDYTSVVPSVAERPNQMLTETKSVTQTIDRVCVVSNERVRSVEFITASDICQLRGNDSNAEAEDSVEVLEHTGENVTARYNARYLSEILREVGSANVRYHWGDPTLPLLIKGEDIPNVNFVVMPLRAG